MSTPLLTVDDYEAAARAALSPGAWGYFRSGADGERTLAWNRDAFARWQIWGRVLVDVATRDLSTTVLGERLAAPILVAPTAYHRLADADGELATARGAAAAGALYVVSTLATTPLEEVAAASPAPKWFQLYVQKDRGVTRALVERAVAAGYRALVLTVDTPILGRRLADERTGFGLPPGLRMANLNLEAPQGQGSALASYASARHDAAFTWRELGWLASLSTLPLVLKGVMRGDDARRAADAGARAVIVSNHGGRQLDGQPATIDALPEVVDAAAGRCEVLVDGGVRWGTDVLVALALGARAVLLGRPILWGLAVGGAAGVERVLRLVADELDRAMALAGCANVASITRDLVRRADR